MLVAHALWSPGTGLAMWAEDSRPAVTSGSEALRTARPHPFAATFDDLVSVLPTVGAGSIPPDEAALLLPSSRRSPLDSPELVRVQPRRGTGREPMLLAWTVPAARLDPAAALHLLAEPGNDARPGASVHYWSAVATFAVDLAERGQVLPTLDTRGPAYAARWRPVLHGSDVVAMQSLITAMPPVCRAEIDSPVDQSGASPADLLTDAVHEMVDAAVRERLDGAAYLPPRRGRRPRRPPALESWVAALSASDPRLDIDAEEAAEIERILEPWADFGLGRRGPARATFRLVEPVAPNGVPPDPHGEPEDGESDPVDAPPSGWRLEFLLQSAEDPSLLVPADQVWAGGTGLSRWLERPDELLLAELGRASGLYPAIGEALRQSRPCAVDLDTEGTFDFLATRASALDQAGFGVLVPSWWSHRRRLGLRGSAHSPHDEDVAGGRFSRDALTEFDWRLAIGDEPLTDEELAALAAAKAPLVWLRGQWVAVDREQVQRGLEFLRRQQDRPTTAAEVIALAATHPDDLDTPLPVTAIEADGALGDLLSGAAERTLEPLAVPDGLRAELRPYQERGLSWMAFLADLGLGACLADDMGLGKTLQLLALEAHRRQTGPDVPPTLLLCPMSLVGNWQREAARFAPTLRVAAHHGPDRRHGDTLAEQLRHTDLLVTTYQTAVRDIEELAGYRWDRVVLDEAQAIKNSQSRAATAVRRLEAGHRVALTGTPMENRLSELWSIMDFLNPGILGSHELFRTRYAIPVERHGETEPAQWLRRVTRPYLLRRVKTDPQIIDDLPDKIEIKQYCRLTSEQASLYQSVVTEMMDKIESSTGIERRGNVLAAMTKLKQICNHPAQFLHDRSDMRRRSGKVARLEEIAEEILAEGDKALLFTQYTEFAEMLLPHLSARFDTDVAYLHGKTPKKRRDEIVVRFQENDDPALFLLSLRAGGTGLNLTAANHVIHLDRWWNPAVENQATDRAFRIGQKRNVQVRKFICVGTLEEKIDEMIEDKRALADAVVSDGEGWLTELSTGALRDLFTLSEGAVGE